jgi:tetratricopeptide (TPR) repeat protein
MKLLLLAILSFAFYNVTFSQSAEELYSRGNYFMQKQKMDSAMSCFNQSIEKDSTYYKAYHGRGTVYLSAQKFNEAIKDYTTCIRQKFNYAEAFYGRGIAYLGTGKSDKACLDFQEAMNFGLKEAKEAMVLYCR